ncbi:MAG: hypothetical protein CFH34_00751 [Alphaproteobacteria bacterium MarineAlpha9_Bin4]|nr:MAG: hypothetical protein CFH34_00751 [Alphaproteobacteria bacterium MarineAlpha9_Bin4]|tara:strand:+ start:178 stop:894 length:717 start_codon:yes stop_codon:yes gene_type:complete
MLNREAIASSLNEEFFIKSTIRGIPLANGNVSIKIKETKYSLKVNARSTGIFSVILDWSQTIKSFGKIRHNTLNSYRYRSSDFRGNKSGHIEIDYTKIPPRIISAQPDPREDERRKINNNFLLNVNDPATGIFNLALSQCKNTVKIYDGKRIYNIKILKKEYFVLKDPFFGEDNIKTYKCDFEIERITGYTKKELERFPQKGEMWIKKHDKINFFYPTKIQIKTTWGNFLCIIKERRE